MGRQSPLKPHQIADDAECLIAEATHGRPQPEREAMHVCAVALMFARVMASIPESEWPSLRQEVGRLAREIRQAEESKR